ncbi:hypothetical protein EVAR_84007_1 [Eumeta japonica]|uniref:Uncharacterized protein n=1 Tax=Eumeta variegata TaxID=151549 RepID=A0A4C1X7F1_EUMVA|nr:hypothetical protein EVAR_84007_1 [Eumeta japonica]
MLKSYKEHTLQVPGFYDQRFRLFVNPSGLRARLEPREKAIYLATLRLLSALPSPPPGPRRRPPHRARSFLNDLLLKENRNLVSGDSGDFNSTETYEFACHQKIWMVTAAMGYRNPVIRSWPFRNKMFDRGNVGDGGKAEWTIGSDATWCGGYTGVPKKRNVAAGRSQVSVPKGCQRKPIYEPTPSVGRFVRRSVHPMAEKGKDF